MATGRNLPSSNDPDNCWSTEEAFLKFQNSTVSRLDTFVRFHAVPGLSRAQLAESGFIYNKSDNSLECVWCACKVTNWPMMSIHSILGSHRVTCSSVASSLRPVMEPDNAAVFSDNATVSPLPDDEDAIEGPGESTTTGVEIDLSEARNEMAADSIHVGPAPAQSRQQNTTDKPDIASVRRDNERLQEEITCKKCKRNRVGTLFLPCRHLVSCEECAEDVDFCFHCNAKILGTVRTFMI